VSNYTVVEYVEETGTVRVRNLHRAGVLVNDLAQVDTFLATLKSTAGATLATAPLTPKDLLGTWEGAFNGPPVAQDARLLVEVVKDSSRGRWAAGIRYVPFE
jgi:hypothetical protein